MRRLRSRSNEIAIMIHLAVRLTAIFVYPQVFPVITDDQCREMLLRKKPDFSVSHENLNAPLEEGETLFWATWKLYPEKRDEAYKKFAMMSQADDVADQMNIRRLGRFHNPAEGTGFGIFAAKTALDAHAAMYHWVNMCEMKVAPVVTDAQVIHIIQSKEGFQVKSDALQKKMADMKVSYGGLKA